MDDLDFLIEGVSDTIVEEPKVVAPITSDMRKRIEVAKSQEFESVRSRIMQTMAVNLNNIATKTMMYDNICEELAMLLASKIQNNPELFNPNLIRETVKVFNEMANENVKTVKELLTPTQSKGGESSDSIVNIIFNTGEKEKKEDNSDLDRFDFSNLNTLREACEAVVGDSNIIDEEIEEDE